MNLNKIISKNINGLKECLVDDCEDIFEFYKEVIANIAKDYAKYHVDKALIQASNNASILVESLVSNHNKILKVYHERLDENFVRNRITVNKQSIISSYSEENIFKINSKIKKNII